MADIFISYSRKDIAFARLLHKALRDSGFETWIDWQDIPPSADWLEEVYDAIEGADSFVFIISPTAVRSEICEKEIAHAVKNNKRLIPIVIDQIDPQMVPASLTPLNWIFFKKEEEAAFHAAVQDLIQAIQTDHTWVKEHTRLQIRALEWERKSKENGYLMRGGDLSEAEQWLSKSAEKDPPPTVLQTQFIMASQGGATRRQRITLSAILAGLIIAIGLGIVAWTQRNVAVHEGNQRATAQAVAEEQRDIAISRQLSILSANELSHNWEIAILLGIEAKHAADTTESDIALRQALFHPGRTIKLFKGHSDQIHHLAWNSDRNSLASSSEDGTVRIWEVETGEERLVLLGHTGPVYYSEWNNDATQILTAGSDGTARVWDSETGLEVLKLTGHEGEVYSASWDMNNSRILTASEDGTARVWDAETGREIIQLSHLGPVRHAKWSRDGEFILTSGDQDVRIWNSLTGTVVADLDPYPLQNKFNLYTNAVNWNGDQTRAVTAGFGEILVWDVSGVFTPGSSAGQPILLTSHKHAVPGMEIGNVIHALWSSDGSRILSVSTDGSVEVWDSETGQGIFELSGHTDAVNYGEWSSDGKRIVTVSSDGTARIWNAENGQEITTLTGHRGEINYATWIDAGARLATAGSDGDVRIWMVDAIEEGISFPCGVQERSAWNSDGTLIATSGYSIQLWDSLSGLEVAEIQGNYAQWNPAGTRLLTLDDGTDLHLWNVPDLLDSPESSDPVILKGHLDKVLHAAWNETGTVIASVSADGMVRLWDAETGDELAILVANDGAPSYVAWNTKGSRLLSQGEDSVQVWNVEAVLQSTEDQIPQVIIHQPEDIILYTAWDPQGTRIITAGEDGKARIWNADNGQELMVLSGHTDAVTHTEWNISGTRIVTTSNDNTARIWDSETGQELLILSGHTAQVAYAEWNLNSNAVITAGWDATARLWDAVTGQEIAVISGYFDAVRHAAWNPEGDRFVLTSWGGPARTFFTPLTGTLEEACLRTVRNFTKKEWDKFIPGTSCRATCSNLPDLCSSELQ
ncbi:MAG: TIR domain-containing protein [Anaerolineales bacterium]|nr:TIR domain-containing protein [Anaerolineales bacterium]